MEKPSWFKVGTKVLVVNPDAINVLTIPQHPLGTIFIIDLLGQNDTGPLCWGPEKETNRGIGFYPREIVPATKICARFYGKVLK